MNLRNMKQSETTEQIKLFQWAEVNKQFVPELKLLHHVPNEGKRSNGALLKAAGLKTGVPDIVLPVSRRGFHGLYVELKFGSGKVTKAQKEFMCLLEIQNYKTQVAYGAEEAREIIRWYLSKADNFNLINCEEAPKAFDRCEGFNEEWTPCKTCEFHKLQEGSGKICL